MMNKEVAISLFDNYSCLINGRDVIPEEIVEKFTSKEAVEFAKKMKRTGHSGYGNGLYTLMYLTKEVFFEAVTYQNIEEYRKAGADYAAN